MKNKKIRTRQKEIYDKFSNLFFNSEIKFDYSGRKEYAIKNIIKKINDNENKLILKIENDKIIVKKNTRNLNYKIFYIR